MVIVGAGFGGLTLARSLAGQPVRVTLVDRRNFHTFQPLLYQVATAGLQAESIAHTVRGIFHGQANIDVRLGTVDWVDWEARSVHTDDGANISFDYLVLAAGAVTSSFGIPGVDEHALTLKTIEDALRLRSHLLRQLELVAAAGAEGSGDDRRSDDRLTVVIAGGGPTGVELAGALVELFSQVLAKDYPRLDLSRARVIVVEGTDHLLGAFAPQLRDHARRTLEARGVEVLLGEFVDRVNETAVHLRSGRVIPTRTLIWAAGVKANPLAEVLGLPLSRGGRIAVEPSLRVAGRRDVFVIGDLAACPPTRAASPATGHARSGKDARRRHPAADSLPSGEAQQELLPQLAPVAMQQARHVAAEIRRASAGRDPKPFRYRDKGSMATIGRNQAVAQLPLGIHVAGFAGWVLWLGLHLVTLIGFRNRASVLVDWSWNYLTYDRGVRLILEVPDAPHTPAAPEAAEAGEVVQRRDPPR